MRRLEQIAAIVMMVLAAVTVFGTGELSVWDEHAPGPRFIPLVMAGVSFLLGIALLRESSQRVQDEPIDWPDRAGRIRLGQIMLAIVIFIGAAPWTGLVVGSALFVGLLLVLVLRKSILPSLFTAAITAVLIQGVFVWWLGTALPKGVFGI